MRLLIDGAEFSEALGTAIKWVPANPHVAASRGYLISREGETVSINATDAVSSSIVLYIDAAGDTDDYVAAVIEAKSLNNIVSTMARTGDPIVVDLDESGISLSCHGHNSSMVSIANSDEFPSQWTSDVGGDDVSVVPADKFSKCIADVRCAADQDNPRYVLSGIHFNSGDVVSADGNRIVVSRGMPIYGPPITVPAASCFKMAGAMSSIVGDVQINVSSNKVYVVWENGMIVTSTISGEYPDYKSILPEGSATKVAVHCDEMSIALDIARQFSSSSNLVIMKLKDNDLIIESDSHMGKHTSKLSPIKVYGPDITIGMSSTFLSDAIGRNKGGQVAIGMNGPRDVVIVSVVGESAVHYIMPMHILDHDQEKG